MLPRVHGRLPVRVVKSTLARDPPHEDLASGDTAKRAQTPNPANKASMAAPCKQNEMPPNAPATSPAKCENHAFTNPGQNMNARIWPKQQ